jgi:hypothetical protein
MMVLTFSLCPIYLYDAILTKVYDFVWGLNLYEWKFVAAWKDKRIILKVKN